MLSSNKKIYLPKHKNIPIQDSPQCYYFSFLHLLAMHGNQNNVPPYVKEIVETCKYSPKEQYRKIMIEKITKYAEDLTWIEDEIIDNEDSDYEGDWIEDFVDTYGVDFAMARLLNLSLKEFEDANIDKDNLTTGQLQNILEAYGPIAIRLKRGNKLQEEKLSASEAVATSDGSIKRNIYNIDTCQVDTPHCVLLIGSKDQPKQQVYFVDPNYPEAILSMDFNLFKENILIPEFIYFDSSNLRQDNVIFLSKRKRSKNDHDDSIQEWKRFRKETTQENSISNANRYGVISVWRDKGGSMMPETFEDGSHLFPELSKFFGNSTT